MLETALIVFYLAVPVGVLWLSKRYRWVDKVGAVTVCYVLGILVGNLPDMRVPQEFASIFMGAAILLSIPLLLFSADFGVWRKMGLKLTLSFLLCAIAVTIAVIAGTFLYKHAIPDAWKISSMLMGVYTGGAPNLAVIGLSLNVNTEDFLVVSAVEMLFGGIWLLFLLALAKPVLSRIMPGQRAETEHITYHLDESIYWRSLPMNFLLAAVIAAIAYSPALFILDAGSVVQQSYIMTIAFLIVTTLGVAGSAIPWVKKLKGSFGLGNYLLLVFCVAVGTLADVDKVFGSSMAIITLVGFVMFLAIAIHLILSMVCKIDVDTFIISSAAAIFGPPFIAPIAKAIKSPYIIPVGLALGVLGLAVGNYCGLGISRLLRLI